VGLIVMLHGCSQDPCDFATGTDMNRIAQKHGLAVAYPAQTADHNGSSCWNWFTPANQSRGAGEPALLAGLARGLMREFGLGRDAVFVAGLSAGGAMAVILADTYPDVFSAAGVHSGLARGAASDVMSALSAMRSGGAPSAAKARRPPAAGARGPARRIVFHGDADRAVHPSNAPQIVRAAVGLRTPARVTPAEAAGRIYLRTEFALPDGTVDVELWQVKGAGHAWSGGKTGGSFTDPRGPDASAEMVRFFLAAPG
jgi:poly(hydroxyalkanoate) depolymerase family esterase